MQVDMQRILAEPEIHRIEVPFQNIATTHTNAYVVRDGDDVLVVDMGAPTQEAARAFVQALSQLGLRPEEEGVRYFFTHLHFDHSGLASMLLSDESEIFINTNELRSADEAFERRMSAYVRQRLQEEGMSPRQAEETGAVVEIATPLDLESRNVTLTEEGSSIQVGRFTFEVIGLPGHTRGMQGLYQPDTGVCFSGDQLLFVISPPCGLFLDEADSVAAYAGSMGALMSLPISQLLHSHGPIRPDFRERAAKILESRERRLAEVESIVAENPGIRGVDAIRKIRWKIPFASIDECGARQQWLIYTQGIALLDHLAKTRRVRRVSQPSLEGNVATSNTYFPA